MAPPAVLPAAPPAAPLAAVLRACSPRYTPRPLPWRGRLIGVAGLRRRVRASEVRFNAKLKRIAAGEGA